MHNGCHKTNLLKTLKMLGCEEVFYEWIIARSQIENQIEKENKGARR